MPVLQGPETAFTLDGGRRTAKLIIGERQLHNFFPEIDELRLRCKQQDDRTTDPRYFVAANRLKGRRIAVVLIRRNLELEACALFIEYRRFGVGLGLLRGGDAMGDGIIVAPGAFRMEYVHLAVQALLQSWRVHGISLMLKAPIDQTIDVMGPRGKDRSFFAREVRHKLPLESTYRATLAAMGPRTRRSLAGKRQQLEKSLHVAFLPSLEPGQALEAMLKLRRQSLPDRIAGFYHGRYRLLCDNPEFFFMGMHLPDGTWLSILSGWRRNQITYVDLQMNHIHFKKESLSAVMRAFMLEHEILYNQKMINFVGGTSLLLRRYCQPVEQTTEVCLWRPCFRASFFKMLIPLIRPESVYEHNMVETGDRSLDIS
jgi:hypothetical protein